MVYTDRGGMLAGSLDLYDRVVSWYVAESGVPFLSGELRLAPEATKPTSLTESSRENFLYVIKGAPAARHGRYGRSRGSCRASGG